METDGNVYALANSAHEHRQNASLYRSQIEHPLETERFAFINLTDDDNIDHGTFDNGDILAPDAVGECDFADIDDLRGASTTAHGLSLPLDRISEEELEIIDLTGISGADLNNFRSIGTNERQMTKIPKTLIGLTPVTFLLEVSFPKGLMLLPSMVSL
jgi:hypothetical protein